MIDHVEGVVLRNSFGLAHLVQRSETDGAVSIMPVPQGMHPLAARGIGHSRRELDAAADRGARVVLSIERGTTSTIVEIDEIAPVSADDLAAARAWLAPVPLPSAR